MNTNKKNFAVNFYLLLLLFLPAILYSQKVEQTSELDKQVQSFLESHRGKWRDMNVPVRDGQLLYDLIIENNYKKAVEIGTSTGHSSIWIAWALSKTGGKLITIEIDRDRYNEALKNFEEAGVSEYIDARLANAHELVPELEGPVDFVFCDADKAWYTNYFKALEDNLVQGACFAVHNTNMRGVREYLEYVEKLDGYKTRLDESGRGMGMTFKVE
jgi:predicted O-methyltransferase YrrM